MCAVEYGHVLCDVSMNVDCVCMCIYLCYKV